jgi:hypothetical protein
MLELFGSSATISSPQHQILATVVILFHCRYTINYRFARIIYYHEEFVAGVPRSLAL